MTVGLEIFIAVLLAGGSAVIWACLLLAASADAD